MDTVYYSLFCRSFRRCFNPPGITITSAAAGRGATGPDRAGPAPPAGPSFRCPSARVRILQSRLQQLWQTPLQHWSVRYSRQFWLLFLPQETWIPRNLTRIVQSLPSAPPAISRLSAHPGQISVGVPGRRLYCYLYPSLSHISSRCLLKPGSRQAFSVRSVQRFGIPCRPAALPIVRRFHTRFFLP